MSNYIEYDDAIVTYGNAIAKVYYNDELIASIDVPPPFFEDKYRDSINSSSDVFSFRDINYEINITSSNAGTYITVESIDDDSDIIKNFYINIEIADNEEYFEEEDEIELKINLYVPTLSYTKTTSSALIDIADGINVIPLIDIDRLDKLNEYKKDNLITYTHFLDISSMRDISNKEEREEIKKKRRDEKKIYGKFKTDLPSIQVVSMSSDSKTEQFKKIDTKENIIPVYKWDEYSSIEDLKLYVRNLVPSYYENLVIRVVETSEFLKNKDEIKKLPISHVILDMNTNFDVEHIKKIIDKIENDFDMIIYLGAQFNAEDISISQEETNINLIARNRPLIVFETLAKEIGYGDYCGFDRKTITELPSGGRATSRVVLNSLDTTKKILVRRGFDIKDIVRDPVTKKITKFGNTNSMKKLLCDIKQGLLDREKSSVFMNENVCDADYSLKDFCPDPTSPAVIKTLCFRHNIFAIKEVFLSSN